MNPFTRHAWGADLGLFDTSVTVISLHTLLDRRAVLKPNAFWNWESEAAFKMAKSRVGWKKEVKDSFTPFQLDAFHALLWQVYHGPFFQSRPEERPDKEERDAVRR